MFWICVKLSVEKLIFLDAIWIWIHIPVTYAMNGFTHTYTHTRLKCREKKPPHHPPLNINAALVFLSGATVSWWKDWKWASKEEGWGRWWWCVCGGGFCLHVHVCLCMWANPHLCLLSCAALVYLYGTLRLFSITEGGGRGWGGGAGWGVRTLPTLAAAWYVTQRVRNLA